MTTIEDLMAAPVVRLTESYAGHECGELGTVVSCHVDHQSLVEFADKNGVTKDLVMIPNRLLKAADRDVLTWRPDAPQMVAYLRQIKMLEEPER